ncbi:MAG: M48 family metalloprotease [Actinobacteria bacterium]|nr:M48 family metalloprotease [Actinomycetota bacterium]
MVAVGRARRVKVLAHVVPVLVSLMLLLVFGAVLPGLPGLLLALGLAFTVPFALTRTGERATVRVFLRARAPTLVDRVALTPVAQVLHEHGVRTDRLTLLVTAGPEVDAYGVGRHTVLVTTALVDALGSRRVSAAQGAAVIAHELGVLNGGLARADAVLVVVLTPWRVWLRFVGVIVGVFAGITGVRCHYRGLIWLMAGVCLWLAYDEHQPAYLGSVTILALVLLQPVWEQRWRRARHQIGDTYLQQVGLGQPLATFLRAGSHQDEVRERALRLSMKVPG